MVLVREKYQKCRKNIILREQWHFVFWGFTTVFSRWNSAPQDNGGSAQLMQILGVLITTGKPAKWRPELDGENGNANTGSWNRVVSRLSARFPVLKWRSRPLAKPLYCQKSNYRVRIDVNMDIADSISSQSVIFFKMNSVNPAIVG